jgi:hypothetical protein
VDLAVAPPKRIRAAIDGLDRFHLQVLELACHAGGLLTAELAEREGLEPGLLVSAGRRLAHAGLAALRGESVWVPAHVRESAPRQPGLGPNAASLLARVRMEELRRIAASLGVSGGQAGRQELVAKVASALGQLGQVRQLIAEAPAKAVMILNALREHGGSLSWSELAEHVKGVIVERGRWYPARGDDERGVSWLRARGLVIATDWEYSVSMPAEVALALRERVFDSWEPEPPPLELSHLMPDRHPVELVVEMDALLELYRDRPPTLLRNGDLGAREVRRAATGAGLPEGVTRFMVGLAALANLVAADGATVTVRGDALAAWRSQVPVERWGLLFEAWHRRLEGNLALAVESLMELPEGQGGTTDSLARRLAWLRPRSFPSEADAAQAIAAASATLHQLGIVPSGPSLGLTDLGRSALVRHGAGLAAHFPSVETSCTVQADLRVVVSGPPDPDLALRLSRLADLETATPARVYRLSQSSVRRALDEGLSASAIIDFLRERGRTRLPSNVSTLIEELGRRHGRLRVGTAALYLEADDEALLAEVMASSRLRAFKVRRIAPTLAIVEGGTGDPDRLLEALGRAGYLASRARR